MGFRSGSFAKVWSIEPVKSTVTKGRISISRKNRESGQYEQDFGGFVSFIGTAAAAKAATLKEGDRIKLGDVDVTNVYNKDKGVTYTNFNVYSFEMEESSAQAPAESHEVDDGEVDDRLPF